MHVYFGFICRRGQWGHKHISIPGHNEEELVFISGSMDILSHPICVSKRIDLYLQILSIHDTDKDIACLLMN